MNYYRKDKYDIVLLDAKITKLKEMSLYQKLEIDSKVLICFTNADMDSLQEIKRQSPEMDNNIIPKSLSLDDQTRLDILLLDNNDTIIIKP